MLYYLLGVTLLYLFILVLAYLLYYLKEVYLILNLYFKYPEGLPEFVQRC